MNAHDWAERLASGEPIDAPVALVVAHPDDETLWAGAALHRLRNLTLFLITDGAPRDMADAHRLGLSSREGYARLRRKEFNRALTALEAKPKVVRFRICDQETVREARMLRAMIEVAERRCDLIITHPYEGGHPDHDTLALAASSARRTPVVEFACYALQGGQRVFGRFVPDPASPEHTRALTPADRARVDAALDAHASQAHVFGDWRPTHERWRAAPAYDFTRPPPGEGALYDGFGWALTSDRWRAIAAEALQPA